MATILLTGAGRGLGLEFSRQFSARGDTVIATARNPAQADELNRLATSAGGRIELRQLDVADPRSMEALKRDLDDRPIDILLNNAGVLNRSDDFPIDYDDWHEALVINTLAPAYMASLFLDNVRASEQRKIVTITSHMASFGQGGGIPAYRTSKSAVNRAMVALASTVRADGIAVGLYHPGWVRTDMGGASAAVSPQQSVAGLIERIDALNMRDSGRFLSYDGGSIPW